MKHKNLGNRVRQFQNDSTLSVRQVRLRMALRKLDLLECTAKPLRSGEHCGRQWLEGRQFGIPMRACVGRFCGQAGSLLLYVGTFFVSL